MRISTYENLQGLVDVILVTLNTLMNEMVFPTDGNITDCICYGDPKYETVDIRKGLHCAIEQQKVVKRVFGTLRLYVVANENLWKCVNPLRGLPTHFPDAIWVRIIVKFKFNIKGRRSIMQEMQAKRIILLQILQLLAVSTLPSSYVAVTTTKKGDLPTPPFLFSSIPNSTLQFCQNLSYLQ